MDFLNKAAKLVPGQKHGSQSTHGSSAHHEQQSKHHNEGGIGGFFNNALGGGKAGEDKEDGLDKAIDMFQERVLKQGPQNNESALEQAKDEQISDAIRAGYKSMTGKNFPIADK